ncbi:MAG: Na+/H+ antiporter NhaC family protein [Lachnospiraceae bacterium]|nr:Na+/H+ antiporter NhaC family protein [Lachnospiraceae bacterium]
MNYGFLSILPSILAIGLALATKNVFLALLTSLLFGNFLLADCSLIGMLVGTKEMIVNVFSSGSSTSIIIILTLLGGMFYMIEDAGGLKGFTALMIEKRSVIKSRVGAELFTWLVGILVFIDGTLSVMITGSISRPLTKTFNISPEKNAWIVHSTATPLSILIPIAAYGPYIAGFIEAQGIENPTQQMVKAIPFNFYCIFAVLGVAVFILARFDFGPMRRAEADYASGNRFVQNDSQKVDTEGQVSGKARYLLIPMLLMIVLAVAYIFYSGEGNLMKGDTETGLILGTAAGCLYLTLERALSKEASIGESTQKLFTGCGNMSNIVIIMILAYAFSNLLGELGTANYLSGVLIQFLTPVIFTPVAFLLTCLLSFATGTSAGTIAIMMPLLLPMAMPLNIPIPMIVGAVAGGAVFGDHTSPISDTTIMSCSSTGCDVVSHVKTQLPYSLCFAVAACVLYLTVGFMI